MFHTTELGITAAFVTVAIAVLLINAVLHVRAMNITVTQALKDGLNVTEIEVDAIPVVLPNGDRIGYEFPNGDFSLNSGHLSGTEGFRVYDNGYVECLEYGTVHPPHIIQTLKPNGENDD